MLYFPILRTKQGEVKALLSLQQSTIDVISPILQVPPPDMEDDDNQKPLDEAYIDKILKSTEKLFDVPAGLLCYLDPEPAGLPLDLLDRLLTGLDRNPTKPRPLYHFLGNQEYSIAYEDVFGSPQSCVLRIDVNNALQATVAAVTARMQQLDITPSITTLLIDAGDISATNYPLAPIQATVSMLVMQLSGLGFANIAIGSCALPAQQADLKNWIPSTYPRLEVNLFKAVKTATGLELDFADYATGNVITGPGPSRRGLPKVRYTFPTGYYVVKGQKPKLGQPAPDTQYQRLSSMVVSTSHYTHAGFSFGDAHIDYSALASNIGKRGNPTTWVIVNTSHHIELVASMLPSM